MFLLAYLSVDDLLYSIVIYFYNYFCFGYFDIKITVIYVFTITFKYGNLISPLVFKTIYCKFVLFSCF